MTVEAEYEGRNSTFKVVRTLSGKYAVEQHVNGKFAVFGTYTALYKAKELAKELAERS